MKFINTILNSFYTSQGDIPHFLYRSVGKMADKVQAKSQIADKYVFHFGLIKLLVLEELKTTNRDWNTFLFLANYGPEVMPTPSKKVSSAVKPRITHAASSRKRKEQKSSGKEVEKIKDVVKEKKITKGNGIMKEKETEKTKEEEKGKEKQEPELEFEEDHAHDQGFLEDEV